MSEISLRANRLANEFEGYVAARATIGGLDPERVHTLAVTENGMPVEHQLSSTQLSEAAKLLRERGEGLTVSDAQMRRFVTLLGGLRYGALVAQCKLADVDDVLDWLQGFVGVLEDVSDRNTATERERDQLQRQREGARAFFGLHDVNDRLDELTATVDSMRVEQSGDLG